MSKPPLVARYPNIWATIETGIAIIISFSLWKYGHAIAPFSFLAMLAFYKVTVLQNKSYRK